eukprot:jgi/Mesvir1/24814/Mv24153-RA.1
MPVRMNHADGVTLIAAPAHHLPVPSATRAFSSPLTPHPHPHPPSPPPTKKIAKQTENVNLAIQVMRKLSLPVPSVRVEDVVGGAMAESYLEAATTTFGPDAPLALILCALRGSLRVLATKTLAMADTGVLASGNRSPAGREALLAWCRGILSQPDKGGYRSTLNVPDWPVPGASWADGTALAQLLEVLAPGVLAQYDRVVAEDPRGKGAGAAGGGAAGAQSLKERVLSAGRMFLGFPRVPASCSFGDVPRDEFRVDLCLASIVLYKGLEALENSSPTPINRDILARSAAAAAAVYSGAGPNSASATTTTANTGAGASGASSAASSRNSSVSGASAQGPSAPLPTSPPALTIARTNSGSSMSSRGSRTLEPIPLPQVPAEPPEPASPVTPSLGPIKSLGSSSASSSGSLKGSIGSTAGSHVSVMAQLQKQLQGGGGVGGTSCHHPRLRRRRPRLLSQLPGNKRHRNIVASCRSQTCLKSSGRSTRGSRGGDEGQPSATWDAAVAKKQSQHEQMLAELRAYFKRKYGKEVGTDPLREMAATRSDEILRDLLQEVEGLRLELYKAHEDVRNGAAMIMELKGQLKRAQSMSSGRGSVSSLSPAAPTRDAPGGGGSTSSASSVASMALSSAQGRWEGGSLKVGASAADELLQAADKMPTGFALGSSTWVQILRNRLNTSPPLLQGWMYKTPVTEADAKDFKTGWKRRWFVLQGGCLFYYDVRAPSSGDPDVRKAAPKGILRLDGKSATVTEPMAGDLASDLFKLSKLMQGPEKNGSFISARTGYSPSTGAAASKGHQSAGHELASRLIVVSNEKGKLCLRLDTPEEVGIWLPKIRIRIAQVRYLERMIEEDSEPDACILGIFEDPSTFNFCLDDCHDAPSAFEAVQEPVRWSTTLKRFTARGCNATDFQIIQVCKGGLLAATTPPPLQVVDLSGNRIGPSGAEVLGVALGRLKGLKELHLNDNILGDTGLANLAKGLWHSKSLAGRSLRMLGLKNNRICDKGVSSLVKALLGYKAATDHVPQLRTLGLARNKIGHQGAALMAALCVHGSRLEDVDFEGNSLGDEGARAFAKMYQGDVLRFKEDNKKIDLTNPRLSRLNLADNRISGPGAVSLGPILPMGVLQHLNLGLNPAMTGQDLIQLLQHKGFSVSFPHLEISILPRRDEPAGQPQPEEEMELPAFMRAGMEASRPSLLAPSEAEQAARDRLKVAFGETLRLKRDRLKELMRLEMLKQEMEFEGVTAKHQAQKALADQAKLGANAPGQQASLPQAQGLGREDSLEAQRKKNMNPALALLPDSAISTLDMLAIAARAAAAKARERNKRLGFVLD